MDRNLSVEALLSNVTFSGITAWGHDQRWLAQLVVALVEERTTLHVCHDRSYPFEDALRDFNLTEELWAKLKERMEAVVQNETSFHIDWFKALTERMK